MGKQTNEEVIKPVYIAFLALNSLTLGDKNDFYPGRGRITSHGRFSSCFRGKAVGVMVVRVFFNIFPQIFLNNLPSLGA